MSSIDYNIVRETNKVQGTTNPADLAYQIIRDYNVRSISVQNSSTRPIGISITAYYSGPIPDILSVIGPGEIKYLSINSQGEPMQYIWPLDILCGRLAGDPYPLRSDANAFVLRDGINKWWVSAFTFPSYSAPH